MKLNAATAAVPSKTISELADGGGITSSFEGASTTVSLNYWYNGSSGSTKATWKSQCDNGNEKSCLRYKALVNRSNSNYLYTMAGNPIGSDTDVDFVADLSKKNVTFTKGTNSVTLKFDNFTYVPLICSHLEYPADKNPPADFVITIEKVTSNAVTITFLSFNISTY